LLKEFNGKKIRVLAVWEPVLPTDWGAPSSSALKRISDPRAAQFWDKGRLLSHAMGEHDKDSIVWDHILVYDSKVVWNQVPQKPLWEGGPVLDVMDSARTAIKTALVEVLGGD
jgi:hypothetical protein